MTIKNKVKQGKLGPHELQEAKLMLAGKKEVAYFHCDYPEVHFQDMKKCLDEGVFESIKIGEGPPYETLVVWVPGAKDKAFKLIELIQYSWKNGCSESVERQKGQILGYSEEDIDFYIAHLKSRSRL